MWITFYVSVKKIITRMKSLRDVYNKNRKPKPTGSGNKPLSETNKRIMEMCDFLKHHVTSRESKSNLKKFEEAVQVFPYQINASFNAKISLYYM